VVWAKGLVEAMNPLTDGNSNSFVESAVWADDIKEPGMNFMDDWHFTDKPVNPNGILM
jgi:hypothetical protein